jgi:hypothetical protein
MPLCVSPEGGEGRVRTLFRCLLVVAVLALPVAAQVSTPRIVIGKGIRFGGFSPPPPFFFYVDTVTGNDANTGKFGLPWLSTDGINSTGFSADTVAVASGQVIAYQTLTGWEWYRALNMQANQTQLTVDVMTGACDAY